MSAEPDATRCPRLASGCRPAGSCPNRPGDSLSRSRAQISLCRLSRNPRLPWQPASSPTGQARLGGDREHLGPIPSPPTPPRRPPAPDVSALRSRGLREGEQPHQSGGLGFQLCSTRRDASEETTSCSESPPEAGRRAIPWSSPAVITVVGERCFCQRWTLEAGSPPAAAAWGVHQRRCGQALCSPSGGAVLPSYR